MTRETEREKFEQWMKTEGPNFDAQYNQSRNQYWSSHTHRMWESWQARAALEAKQVEALLPCPFCGDHAETDFIPKHHSYAIECHSMGCAARVIKETATDAIEAWNRRAPAEQAQRAPLSDYKQALDFLAGLHPGITIDGPPMAVAELIFDAVQADQRALKEEIEKKERNLDWMRKELAKRPSGITQEKQG